jgi:fumarate reductase subunit D
MKRSNKPIFWSLFGAGGMLSALVGPALIFITAFQTDKLSYDRVLLLAQNGFGKLAILAVIGLFLFHGCHRMYHSLHDFGIHVGAGLKAAFHGFAAAGTLAAAVLLALI